NVFEYLQALPAGYAHRGYATRKTIAQGLLDLALLLANGSQLKALIQTPEDKRDFLFVPVLVLIGLSVGIQVCVGILIIILGNMEAKTEREQRRANIMNNATVALILFITVVNVFISAFGIKFSGQDVTIAEPVTQTLEQVSKTVLEQVSWASNTDMAETTPQA
ncbi:ninjurin-2-like, partial [Gigantopelta aegis]|uniref:ninjurin-2-like n=1 Tax=Gigantopelta aegis TaxID=1735272 RepID=UPI001B88823F